MLSVENEEATLIYYESPNRLLRTLKQDLNRVLALVYYHGLNAAAHAQTRLMLMENCVMARIKDPMLILNCVIKKFTA